MVTFLTLSAARCWWPADPDSGPLRGGSTAGQPPGTGVIEAGSVFPDHLRRESGNTKFPCRRKISDVISVTKLYDQVIGSGPIIVRDRRGFNHQRPAKFLILRQDISCSDDAKSFD